MIRKIPAICFFYILLAISTACFIRSHIRYAGVQSWPKVEAFDLEHSGSAWSQPIQTRTGPGTTSFNTRGVTFRYQVDGVVYQGTRYSPSRRDVLFLNQPGPLHAYHHPEHPGIAVLSNEPYRGLGWIATMTFAGLFVGVHLLTRDWK